MTAFETIVNIWGIGDDLGNKIHSHLIYEASREEQDLWLAQVNTLLNDFSDRNLKVFGFDQETKRLLGKLISNRTSSNRTLWLQLNHKIFKGLRFLLKREIAVAKPLRQKGLAAHFITEIKKSSFYHPSDTLVSKKNRQSIEVRYICKDKSPEHDGTFTPWRDTEFTFEVHLDKGLFVWTYLNVHKEHRGKGFGTAMVKSVEGIARKLGVKRFSVEYPNRRYWRHYLGYTVPAQVIVGREGYSIEAYKEFR
ncbi:MAG TPA: GNAT family N-acetyltransferase [Candidatus Nanoarchaeia archaeon]|nr:GNAT family N-acetyltransferase [Candidatus Nanoarchaeia archaeon]